MPVPESKMQKLNIFADFLVKETYKFIEEEVQEMTAEDVDFLYVAITNQIRRKLEERLCSEKLKEN